MQPIFRDEDGEAPLVKSGANALIAFKCCIENNHLAEFLIGRFVALPSDQKWDAPVNRRARVTPRRYLFKCSVVASEERGRDVGLGRDKEDQASLFL